MVLSDFEYDVSSGFLLPRSFVLLESKGGDFVVVFLQKLDSLEMAQEAYIFLEYLTVLDVVQRSSSC